MPTKAEIVNQIETQIIPNLMELITGGILQNVLLGMVDQINTLVGELGDLNTDDRSSIVNAINELVYNIQAIEDNLTPYVYFGIDDPNVVTPVGFGGDIPSFYVQQEHVGFDVVNVGFWTYTGIIGKEWVNLSLDGGGIQSVQAGDNINVDNTDPENPIVSATIKEEFIQLNDTPSAYTGQAGKFLAVNDDEDGVEFVDEPSGGNGKNNFISSLKETRPEYYFTVMPNRDEDNSIIGNAGLSYNTLTDEYVICYYSYAKASKLWLYGRNSNKLLPYNDGATLEPTPDREIDVSSLIYHLQSVAYDDVDDTYWLLGSKNTTPSNTGNVLVHIQNDGTYIDSTELTYLSFQAGMLSLCNKFDEFVISSNNSRDVYFLDKSTKALKRTHKKHGSYEGLAVDDKRDLIWIGGDNGVMKAYDYTTFFEVFSTNFKTLVNEGGVLQNVEGMLIDPIDDKLLISFDGYLHGENQNGNALFKFDFPRYVSSVCKVETMEFSLSPINTDITTGEIPLLIGTPNKQFEVLDYYITAHPKPTGAAIIVTLKRDTSTFTTTSAQIPAGENNSSTGPAVVFNNNRFIRTGNRLIANVTQVGSSTIGQNLQVVITYRRIY